MIAKIINKVDVSFENGKSGISTNYFSSEMNQLGLCYLYFNDVKNKFYLFLPDKYHSCLNDIKASRYIIMTMGTMGVIANSLYLPETFIKLIESIDKHMHLLFEDNTNTPFSILLSPLAVKGAIHLLQNKRIYDIAILNRNLEIHNSKVYFRCNEEDPFQLPYGLPINTKEFVRC